MIILSLNTSGDFRAIGGRPQSGNVDGGLNIGIANKTAGITGKPMLTTSTNRVAARACFGCSSRIYQDERHTCLCCFVGNELPELIEGPASHETTQELPLPAGAFTNALQVLQADEAIGFLGKRDYTLADVVIQVLLESAFSPGQPFQDALSASCASPLEGCLGAGKLLPLFIDLAPRKHKAGGSGCDAIDTKIDAQWLRAGWGWFLNIDADISEESSAPILIDGSSADLEALEQFALVASQFKPDADSAAARGKRCFLCLLDESKQVFVKGNTGGLESRGLVLRCYAVKNSNAVVCRQAVSLSDVVVVKGGQGKLMEHALPIPVLCDLIAGSGEANHRFRESASLILSKDQLAFHGLDHKDILPRG